MMSPSAVTMRSSPAWMDDPRMIAASSRMISRPKSPRRRLMSTIVKTDVSASLLISPTARRSTLPTAPMFDAILSMSPPALKRIFPPAAISAARKSSARRPQARPPQPCSSPSWNWIVWASFRMSPATKPVRSSAALMRLPRILLKSPAVSMKISSMVVIRLEKSFSTSPPATIPTEPPIISPKRLLTSPVEIRLIVSPRMSPPRFRISSASNCASSVALTVPALKS